MKTVILILTLLAMVGCTTTKTLPANHDFLTQSLEVGDRILIHLRDERQLDLNLTGISTTHLSGTSVLDPFDEITVDFAQVVSIEREEESALTVLGTVAAVIVIVPLAILSGLVSMEWE